MPDGSAEVLTLEEMFQVRDLAFAFENVEGPRCVDQRDSRTVVTPVFEAVQTPSPESDRHHAGPTYPTIPHICFFRYLSGLKIVKYFTNIAKKAGIYTRPVDFLETKLFFSRLPDVFPHLLHDSGVACDDRDAAVTAEVADDASGLPEDQFGGADVPFVERQLQ